LLRFAEVLVTVASVAPHRPAVFPPGIRHLTPFPFMRTLRADPLAAVGRVLAQHGDAVGIKGGPIEVVVVARPEYARHVLVRNARNYGKGAQIAKLRRIAGDGVFFVDGDAWRRQRRMIAPAFQRARIEAMVPQLVGGADELVLRWTRRHGGGGFFDASPDLSRVALDVVCRAMFGADVREHADVFHRHAAFAASYAQYLFDHVLPLPRWIPTERNLRLKQAMEWVHGFVHGMIEEHRRRDPLPDDLLGLLLALRDEESGAALSDAELYDELMTFVNAGHETTAVALSWALFEIGRDPELHARLSAEVDAHCGREAPTLAALAKLDLLGRTIKEVLRVHPPGWALPRQALAQDEIDGVLIPKGATVMIAVYHLHRHPEFWSEPERFDPERWREERGEPKHAFAYLPFGLGGRRCVGEDFALLELRTVLARLLQHFRIETDPAHPVVARPQLTLKPAHGVRLRLALRMQPS
jgi:cytochrome P450